MDQWLRLGPLVDLCLRLISPTQPFTVQTLEIDEVLVTPVETGLANPFDMAFQGYWDILVTESYTGQLKVVRDGRLLKSDLSYLPEIYTVGNRNIISLSHHLESGELWTTENGPQGCDEANNTRPGANYGWPIFSSSRKYRRDRVSENPWDARFADPKVIW